MYGPTILLAASLIPATSWTQPRAEISSPESVQQVLLRASECRSAADYRAARTILTQALAIRPEAPELLNALGSVEQDLGNYLEAERLYLRALSGSRRVEGESARLVISILNNFATLYVGTHQYAKCQRIRRELDEFRPETFARHPAELAGILNILASLEYERHRYDEAERIYLQSLELWRQAGAAGRLGAAAVENNLGMLRLEAGLFDLAVDLFRQAIVDSENAAGPEHRSLIHPLIHLAESEYGRGRPSEAEPAARRAVELSTRIFGTEHPATAAAMQEHARVLRKLHRNAQARTLEKQANAVLRKSAKDNRSDYTVDVKSMSLEARR